MKRWTTILGLLLASTCCIALAAEPPTTMNYQGVLRDSADRPRTGTFDMTFRLFDAQTSGSEILVDAHTGGAAVTVTAGLFNLQLGGGAVTDGSGFGVYASLGDVFRDYADVWMGIAVGAETLSPRLKIQATAYALNSSNLQGKPWWSFLDTSTISQTKSGPLTLTSTFPDAVSGSNGWSGGALGSAAFNVGVLGYGGPVGGSFFSTWGSQATVANYAEGLRAVGQTRGGAFANLSGSGGALLAEGETAIAAYGTYPGSAGHFEDLVYSGRVDLASGDTGIAASGSYAAGIFTISGLYVEVGSDNWDAAGYFYNYLTGGPGIWTLVATPWFGLATSGAKNFVQNHPTDPERLIAYSVLEGPEAGTYTRGSRAIRGGEIRIALEPTFALTTNPDTGLTAVVTARRPRADLYVASVSTKELVVRSGSPSADEVAFDYVVNGLRVGFENQPAIFPSDAFPNAAVPSIEASAARLAALPEDSRGSTPLARFSAERALAGAEAPKLAGARALIAGINSPEHALHARAVDPGRRVSVVQAKDTSSPIRPAPASQATARYPGGQASRTGSAAASRTSNAGPASTGGAADAPLPYTFSMPVEMEVRPGDVLSGGAGASGSLRLAEDVGDPAVIGVVVGSPGSRFWGQAPIALAGTVVPCNVDASYRPIAVSDLLVVSPTPGIAMSAGPDPQGTVIGKALEPLAAGTGSIRILVMSR